MLGLAAFIRQLVYLPCNISSETAISCQVMLRGTKLVTFPAYSMFDEAKDISRRNNDKISSIDLTMAPSRGHNVSIRQ
jgi:hypothetical protein